jgi:Protein of unknown function (DUF2892)
MKFENNLSMVEIIVRHFAGLLVGVAGGFLGHYVSSIFYLLVPIAPVLILTAILGWCPLYAILGINSTKHS